MLRGCYQGFLEFIRPCSIDAISLVSGSRFEVSGFRFKVGVHGTLNFEQAGSRFRVRG